MKLAKKVLGDLTIHYRKGTSGEPSSDEQALTEVLERRAYRKVRSGFDVQPGERWLDLGANIGAFTLYAISRGASTVAYEPDADNFGLLEINIKANTKKHKSATLCTAINAAVTASRAKTLKFKTSDNPENRYRGTVMLGSVDVPKRYVDAEAVRNVHVATIGGKFDGIKMDIEGSEGPIFDSGILPFAPKLVLEYHTSRDSSTAHLKSRIEFLRTRYNQLSYPKAFDDAIASGAETFRPRFDQLIFAWDPKLIEVPVADDSPKEFCVLVKYDGAWSPSEWTGSVKPNNFSEEHVSLPLLVTESAARGMLSRARAAFGKPFEYALGRVTVVSD